MDRVERVISINSSKVSFETCSIDDLMGSNEVFSLPNSRFANTRLLSVDEEYFEPKASA